VNMFLIEGLDLSRLSPAPTLTFAKNLDVH
jgi:hypothetical protein